MKQCNKCRSSKELAEFAVDRAKKDGRRNRCKQCVSEHAKAARLTSNTDRRGYLRSTYGLELEDYDRMYEEQGGTCGICKQAETAVSGKSGKVLNLAVDHCHTTGENRGLLCHNCNRGIGYLQDSTDNLRAAINYLEKHND